MAFTGTFITTAFKRQLLEGVHDLRPGSGQAFKLALYSSDATFTADTLAYTTDNEVPDTGDYAAGGGTLTLVAPDSAGTTAFATFADLTFTGVTLTARGALIYNSTPAHTYTDPAVAVLDFGADRVATGGTFTVRFPLSGADTALLRIV
jgi:hypothetical protein